ncbi:TonB-dependent receptor domain-containing protein [Cyclonatronum proteinivorum]|uniref:TonB-dependent receptor domain-containing protein n=1 Tax=Cyclonatronum proteinivorum TaxID=1457365 RepID=UPI001F0BC960|nr:TonB-dependent receptor [Cyclonatronum proteinivorum]
MTFFVTPILLFCQTSTIHASAAAHGIHSQESDQPYQAVVRCAETGHVLGSAHILVQDVPGMHTVSRADGSFELRLSLQGSEQVLQISHLGFHPLSLRFTHISELPAEILLTPKRVNMSPVSVVAHHTVGRPKNGLDITQASFTPIDSGAFLREADNVSGVRRGGFGIDPVVRGNSGSRLNIRVDGLASSAAACPNRMDPPTSHIRLSDIERIEIHHGPHALRFGPSFGGTVDFIRHKPEVSPQFQVQGDVRLALESNTGNRVTDARLHLGNARYDLMLSGGFSATDDYTGGDGLKVPASFESSDFGAELFFRPATGHQLQAGFSQSYVRNADFPALPMDMAMDDTFKLKGGYAWNPQDVPGLRSLRADAYYSYVDHEMNNHNRESFNMRDAVALAETKTWGVQGEAIGMYRSLRWNANASYTNQQIDGTRFVDFKAGPNAGNSMTYNLWQDAIIQNSGLYAGADYFLDAWTISTAIRLDYNTAEARNLAPRFAGTDTSSEHFNLSLSAGISRELSTNTGISLYAGRGVRSPDVTERFINFLAVGRNAFEFAGNPNLKPESTHQLDLVFRTRTNDDALNLQLNGFTALMQNYIAGVRNEELQPMVASAPGVLEFQNRDDVFTAGFEATAEYRLPSVASARLSASYTYAEFTDDGSAVAEIPPFESRLVLTGLFSGRFIPEANIRRVLTQNRFDAGFGEEKTDGFWLADISVRTRVLQNLSLNAGVRNLFDEAYSEHLNRNIRPDINEGTMKLPEPGRRVFVEVSWRF